MNVMQWTAFLALGAVVGAFGTMIGAGGGFLLLPLLVLAYPHDPPSVLTAISLSVVCANATAGSFAYARMGRTDFRAGLTFAAAGVPGAVLGALATSRLDRRVFDPLLGAMLLVGAAVIALRPRLTPAGPALDGMHTLVDADGIVHQYRRRLLAGAVLSVFVGFVSSLMGIGGGILHVPLMVLVLGFPVHVATATSHLVLAILALVGVLTHAGDGSLPAGLGRALPLAAGVLVGAPFGAWASRHLHGMWILRALAAALAAVGLRLLLWH